VAIPPAILFFDNLVAVEVAITSNNVRRKWRLEGKLSRRQDRVMRVSCDLCMSLRENRIVTIFPGDYAPWNGGLGIVIWLFGLLGMANTISGRCEDRINAAKLLRACGGCLGARRR
jgi:hypothetical protein